MIGFFYPLFIFFRHILLKYLDRLEAYMDIVFSCQRNDPDFYFSTAFYVKFRDQPILKAAVEFAHEGKTCAVATLLERYPNELEEYKLCILSNFPESLVPEDYADLIPSTDDLLGPYSTTVVTKDWIHHEFIKESVTSALTRSCCSFEREAWFIEGKKEGGQCQLFETKRH